MENLRKFISDQYAEDIGNNCRMQWVTEPVNLALPTKQTHAPSYLFFDCLKFFIIGFFVSLLLYSHFLFFRKIIEDERVAFRTAVLVWNVLGYRRDECRIYLGDGGRFGRVFSLLHLPTAINPRRPSPRYFWNQDGRCNGKRLISTIFTKNRGLWTVYQYTNIEL